MSASTRRRTAARRATFTGEANAQAALAVRGDSHGLDDCSPEQRRFRAVLALLLLNGRDDGRREDSYLDARYPGRHYFAAWGMSRLRSYTITYSAQYNELVLISDIHAHLTAPLCPRPNPEQLVGLPGLRPLDRDPAGKWYRFTHVPTGGILRLQGIGRPLHWGPSPEAAHYWDKMDQLSELHDTETLAAQLIAPMHPDAEQLLAALTARLTLEDPDEAWAVGGLTWDTLRRPDLGSRDDTHNYLWGHDSTWKLRWGGPGSVPAADVGIALTHPFIGLRGATMQTADDGSTTVRFGAASLEMTAYTKQYQEITTNKAVQKALAGQ